MILLESPGHLFFGVRLRVRGPEPMLLMDPLDLADAALLRLLAEQAATDPTFGMLSIGVILPLNVIRRFITCTFQIFQDTPRDFIYTQKFCFEAYFYDFLFLPQVTA